MIKNFIENANFEDTGFSYTLSLISGKYKMVILYCLMEYEVVRFNELKRYLKNISDKTLSTNLKVRIRPADYKKRVSANSTKGRIQPQRPRKIPDGRSGPAVHLGRKEQIGIDNSFIVLSAGIFPESVIVGYTIKKDKANHCGLSCP